MAGGAWEQSQAGDIHLNASRSEPTLIALWGAGYGDRLRGLGDPFQVVFDTDGVRLHEAGASVDPVTASDWRAFIAWSDVTRVGLAGVSLLDSDNRSQSLRNALTITARSVTIPLLVYSRSTGLASVFTGRSIDMVHLAKTVNVVRGRPDARVNPVDLMRETVPELDPLRRRLAADPERPSRTADELLGAVVRREAVYGPSSARIRAAWRRVQYVAGVLLASSIAVVIMSFVWHSDVVRVWALVIGMTSILALRVASNRSGATAQIVLTELEAGYTFSRSGPVQVDQLDPSTMMVIRRAGERALTAVEEKRARSAARLRDAGGPELPPAEWAILRARQIVSRGEDPEVAPSPPREVRSITPTGDPVWGTGSGQLRPPRYPLLAGRHSRSIAWYRRSDAARRRDAEHNAGYTLSRTLRPDLDQVDPVTGYVIRPATRPQLTRVEEDAALARVRMLPPTGS